MPESTDGRPHEPPLNPGRSPHVGGRELGRVTLLSGQELDAKLASITTGDPLELYPLGTLRVRERFLYFDPDRVFDESAFNVVAMSLGLRKEDDFDHWLVERVYEAIDDLIRRDTQAVLRGRVTDDLAMESGEYLVGCWGLSPHEAFEAAVRFNNLPELPRRAFFALLVDHRTVAQCLEDGMGPPDDLREHTVRAIEAILGPRPDSIRKIRVPSDPAEEPHG
jgi:hypothetical protein